MVGHFDYFEQITNAAHPVPTFWRRIQNQNGPHGVKRSKTIFEADFNADMPAYVKRWVKAKRMRDAGFTFAAIGKALGVGAQMARIHVYNAERSIPQWAEKGFPDFWGMGRHTDLPSLQDETKSIAKRKPAAVLSAIAKMADGIKERDWLHV